MTDGVNNPAHYGGRENDYEAIKVMEAWHGPEAVRWFCILSAEKYYSRAGKKPGEEMHKDLLKAGWYSNYAAGLSEKIDRLRRERESVQDGDELMAQLRAQGLAKEGETDIDIRTLVRRIVETGHEPHIRLAPKFEPREIRGFVTREESRVLQAREQRDWERALLDPEPVRKKSKAKAKRRR